MSYRLKDVNVSSTILIIIQNPTHLRLVANTLQDSGYHVLVARKALDGVDLARKHKLQLVITEIELSDMSGREVATMLKSDARFAGVPIVAIIDPDDDEAREMCIAAGMTGFIELPLKQEALPLEVQFFLSGGSEGLEDSNRLDEARTRHMQDVAKRLEARIRELEAKNAELERLDEQKDTFIQLTAHELRTPLTLITGYSRLLEDHPPLRNLSERDPQIATLIEGLSMSISRMQSIIEEILTTSRIMTKKIELNLTPVNLGSLMRKVLNQFEEALQQRRLGIYFNESEFPVAARCDEALIQQMASNLVSNAIKYTPDGGSILIQAQTNNQLVRFSIKDTGIGIAPENLKRIFERMSIGGDIALHTTSKTNYLGGGLGLGLSICKGIVEAHGGKIWAESPGYDPQTCPGSEFIVVIPIIAQRDARQTTPTIKKLSSRQS
jgi:signal transduction histidine kinase